MGGRAEAVALVHDYLNQRGGAERVFAHIARGWPDAPVYTALFDPRATGDLVDSARVHTSALARIPGANRYFRYLAPLYPRTFERFDLRAYDTIVSSTTAWAKGVRVAPGAVHVCYMNNVSRFVTTYGEYVGELPAGALAAPLVRRLAEWDRRAAQRPTVLVANSRNVAARIERYYKRQARVLHCPVDIHRFTVGRGEGDYFLVVSRLLPYKRIDRAIEAAADARVPLFIAGTGPDRARLQALAEKGGAMLLGYVEDRRLNELMGNARATIVPGEEDFGLVPLESAAAGRPTIALRQGGAMETVVEGVTGAFFDQPSSGSLAEVLRGFDGSRYDAATLRAHAERFAPAQFIARLRAIVEEARG